MTSSWQSRLSAAASAGSLLGLLALVTFSSTSLPLTAKTIAITDSPLATLTVTSTDDADDGTCSSYPGHCSLREAIHAANASLGQDIIDFHPTVSGTILLTSPLPHLTDIVALAGPGASVITVDGNGKGSVLWVESTVAATISGLSLTGGIGSGSGGTAGGGITNRGSLALDHMVIFGNTAQFGGGVFNDLAADLAITNSTLRGNIAANFGGAIYTGGPGSVVTVTRSTLSGNTQDSGAINAPVGTTLAIENSTVSGNIALQNGGVGGVLGGANVHINTSTIVGNTGIGMFSSYLRNSIVDSCGSGGGAVGSQGHNLAPTSACFFAAGPGDVYNPSFLVGPLQNNGGPTETRALLAGSPAIDAGDNATCPAVDQRGYPRPVGLACDIGAYEYLSAPPATPTLSPTPTDRPSATPTLSPTPGCVAAPSGMAAWYPLNELPGATTVVDIWANHHGAPQPGPVGGAFLPTVGPVWGPAALGVVPPFKVTSSLYFWDSQRFVNVPHSPALDIGTGSFSLDAWVYSVSHVPGGTLDFVSPIVDKFDPATSLGYGLYLRHATTGADTLSFVYGDGVNVVTATSNPPTIAQQAWVHVAVTVNRLTGGQLDIRHYVNGAAQGMLVAAPPSAAIANAMSLHIGGLRLVPAATGPAGYTELAIDELEIFNRALTQAEVQSLVHVGSFGKCRPTTGPRPIHLPWVIVSGRPTPARTPTTRTTPTPATTSTPTATPSATDALPSLTPSSTPAPATDTPTATGTASPTRTPSITTTDTATTTPPPTTQVPPTDTSTPIVRPPTDTPTVTPACAAQPQELAAWWALDELAGTMAWDGIGDHNGDVQGGAVVLNPAKVAAGRSFDGTTGLVAVPDAPALDAGTGEFSLDAWIRPQALDGRRPIVTKQYAPADGALGYALFLQDGQLSFAMSNDGSGILGTAPTALTVDNEWHLVAVAIRRESATGGQLFLDGTLIHSFDTTPLVGTVDTPAELHLAHQPALGRGTPANFFRGDLDEVELFHHALTAGEVSAIYAAGGAGKCSKPLRPTATRISEASARRQMIRQAISAAVVHAHFFGSMFK